MILFMKWEWKPKISLDFTGIYRKLQESTGIHRKLKEMLVRVESHAKLATRGRVCIPKIGLEY